jgi:hypothetical protein
MLKVQFLKVGFKFTQFSLQFVYSLLSFLLNLAKTNDLTFALLEFDVKLVDLGDESAAFLLIDFLKVLGLSEFRDQMLLFIPEPGHL